MADYVTHYAPEQSDFRRIGQDRPTLVGGSNLENPYGEQLRQQAEQIRQGRQWLYDQVNQGYELNDREYGQMMNILTNTNDDWDTEVSRIEQAYMFTKKDGIPFPAAYANVDTLVEAETGQTPQYNKTATRAVRDALEIGRLGVLRGQVGMKMMLAELGGNDTDAELYRRQMGIIDEEQVKLQDFAPRNLLTKVLKVTAQSLPYTMDIASKSVAFGAGGMALGGAIGDVLALNPTMLASAAKLFGATAEGASATEASTLMTLAQGAYSKAATVAAWARTAELSTGSVYYDLRQKGVEKNVAFGVASVNGIIQGAIETSLGLIPSMGRAAKIAIMGETAGASLAAKTFAGLYAKGWLGGLAAGLTNVLTTAGGEGLEEFLQSIADNLAEYTALTISKETDYTFDKTTGDVLKEAFREGIAGFGSALLLGLPSSAYTMRADIAYARGLRAEAEANPSRTDFINSHKDDEPFQDFSDKQKKEYLGDVYDKNNKGLFSEVDSEILDTDVLDETNEDEEGLEENAEGYKPEKLKRKENGRLRVQESKYTEEIDGKQRRYMNIGQPDTKQRYGRITYDVGEDKKLYIESVKTRAGYAEDVTYDAVLELARRYEGYDIIWNPENKFQQSVKDKLIADNTVQENSIQRFLGNDIANEDKVAAEFINQVANKWIDPQNRHRIGKAEAGIASVAVKWLARSLGTTIGSIQNDAIQFLDAEGKVRGSLKIQSGEGILEGNQIGGVNKQSILSLLRGGEAIMYVSKRSNLTTLIHEIDHMANLADPENSAKIARDLKKGIEDGTLVDYINTYKKHFLKRTDRKTVEEIVEDIRTMEEDPFKWTEAQNEAVTAFFERYLTEGRTFSPELQNIFEKIADLFRRIIGYLKDGKYLNDSIVKDFDAMLTKNPELKAKMSEDIAAQNESGNDVLMQREPSILFQKISEDELKDRIDNIVHTEQRKDYIKRYYDDIKDEYHIEEFTSSDGNTTGNIEIADDRDRNSGTFQKEIDAMLYFGKLGYDVTLLSESSKVGRESHIDALLNHSVLVELKNLKGNANSIADQIKQGINKKNSEIISVFLYDSALNVSDEDIQKYLDAKNRNGYVQGNTDGVFVFRDNEISEIKISGVGQNAQTSDNLNINPPDNSVNTTNDILPQTDTEYLDAVNSGDMAKAQTMVDARAREQGYTIKAYHGTNNSEETKTWNNERKEWDTKYAPITVFKRRVDGHRNKGHFFASDIDNAGGYGSKLYNVYLKIQDPLVIDCNGSLYSEIYYNGQTKDTYEWAEWAERTGYDGVIFLDIRDGVDYGALQTPLDEYVAFRANQIKSADPVTYDDNGNVIPLSERFNEENDSLIYQRDSSLNARQWLMEDAKDRTLDEFLSLYENDDLNNVDRQYLEDLWNNANGIIRDRRGFHIDTEGKSAEEKDNAFRTVIETDDGVRNVVKTVREVYSTIKSFTNRNAVGGVLDSGDISLLTSTEAKRLAFEEGASDYFKNIAKSDKELDETTIKQLRTTMENNISMYREIMEDISEDETFSASPDYEPDIEDPTQETVTMTDEEKNAEASQVEDTELKKEIRSGTEKFEGRSEALGEELDKELDSMQNKLDKLKETFDNETERLKNRLGKENWYLLKELNRYYDYQEQYDSSNKNIQKLQDARMEVPKSKYEKLNKLGETIKNLEDAIVRLKKLADIDSYLDSIKKMRQLRAEIRNKEKQRRLARQRHEYKQKLLNYLLKMPSKNVNYEEKKKIVDEIMSAVQGAMGYDSEIVYNNKRYTSKEFREAVESNQIDRGTLTKYQMKRVDNKSLSDWTVEELEELARDKERLTKEGRERWQAKVDEQNYIAQVERDAINAEVKKNPKYQETPLPETKESKQQGASLSQKLFNTFISTLRMGSIAQIIDGYKKGTAHKVLVEEKRDIRHQELLAVRKRLRPVIELMEKLGVKEEDFYESHSTVLKGDTFYIGGEEVVMKSMPLTYSVSQLLYAKHSMANERNHLAFIGGVLMTEEEKQGWLAQANRKFTDKEQRNKWLAEVLNKVGEERNAQVIKFANEILSKLDNIMKVDKAIYGDFNNEDNKNRLNKVMIDEYNMAMVMEANYMPIKRLDFNGEDLATRLADEMYNRNAGKGMTSVEKGITKERIDIPLFWQTRVDTDYVSLWLNHVKESEHLIATNAYVRKLNRIFKTKSAKGLRANIEAVYGSRILKDIDNHINEIANPQAFVADRDADKAVRAIRGNLYEAYLGLKLSGFFLQVITSPAPFLREVNAWQLTEKIFKVAAHPFETWKQITDLSPMMEDRIMNPMVEDVEREKSDYTLSKRKRKIKSLKAKTTELLTVADRWMVSAGWLAVYEKRLEIETQNGVAPETAVQNARKYADTVVYETQPMSDRTEMASIFKQGGAAWQVLTQFQVSLNVIWNNLAYDTAYTAIKTGKWNRQQTYTVLAYMLAGLVLYGVQDGFFRDDDDEMTKEEKVKAAFKKILYSTTTQATSSIPLVGSEIDSLLKNMATGEKTYYTKKLYPAFSTTIEGLGDAMSNGVNWNNVSKMGEGVGLWTGYPVSGYKEAEHIFYNRKTGEWRFYPQAVVGRREEKKKRKNNKRGGK